MDENGKGYSPLFYVMLGLGIIGAVGFLAVAASSPAGGF